MHSYYSYKYGTLSPEEAIFTAINNGFECAALTEINNTSSALDFIRLSKKYNFKSVVGIDFRNGNDQKFIGLAIDNTGFYEINRFLTKHLHNDLDFMPTAPSFYSAYIIYPFNKSGSRKLRENELIGIRPSDINKFRFSEWKKYPEKVVILQTATFRNKRDFNAHRLLRAIDKNVILSQLDKSEEASVDDIFISKDKIHEIYYDFPEIINNTERILNNCNVDFSFGGKQHNNKKIYTDSLKNDVGLLKQKCLDAIPYRYGQANKTIFDRLEKEIDIITKKEFVSYFLINWDIINYARSKNYFYVGRGSGANSIIAYLLYITDVDPIELDLYFERFINLYRTNPPDFDIDFSWTDREDITKYIFQRFENTALLGTYNTFQEKSVIRELGKVFGLPKHEIDELSENRKKIKGDDQISKLVFQYSKYIHNFPSHLSVHSSGIIITEKPVENFTATFMPPKGFPTAQIDMVIAEDTGIFKFDILSQRGLGKIKDTIECVNVNKSENERIDIHDIKRFKKDEKIKELLREGQAMGCFYVESPAMRMLMKKLRVDNYIGLVAASSIIRPGVARSGMMREYILRYRFPERCEKAHPVMMDIMPETYGVMVYQEDVIKVAHYFAGLTLGESDVLRRAMSGKFRSREEFEKVKDKFFLNCYKKNYDSQLIHEIWLQIESFAGYAFSKGHSASYAVESFQSLFLKAYFPLEFIVAVLNNFGGFYRTEFYIHEARMHGATINAPCINNSEFKTILKNKDIYLGLNMLNEIESNVVHNVLDERDNNGLYKDFNDFIKRVNISTEQLSILIRINAFRFTGINKRELLWHAHLKNKKKKAQPKQLNAFDLQPKEYKIPELSYSNIENAFDQIEILGFPLCSPFELMSNHYEHFVLAKDLKEFLKREITIIGYLVTYKFTQTANGKIMHFGTFLDYDGFFFDTTHFPIIADKYPFRGSGIYKIKGKVVEEFEFYSIEVYEMIKEPYIEDPRYSDMRMQKKMKKK